MTAGAGDALDVLRSSTRARVAGRTFGRSLSTRETVATDTPAASATSRMVTTCALPSPSTPSFGDSPDGRGVARKSIPSA